MLDLSSVHGHVGPINHDGMTHVCATQVRTWDGLYCSAQMRQCALAHVCATQVRTGCPGDAVLFSPLDYIRIHDLVGTSAVTE